MRPFEPNLKASYTIHKVALGIESYGDLGMLNDVPNCRSKVMHCFFTADLYIDPRWEINLSPGFGLTENTDDFVFKILISRRINWKRGSKTEVLIK